MEVKKCSNKVLEQMLEDLNKHKRTDKAAIMQEYIAMRLNKSLSQYYKSLAYNATYLEHINNNAKQKKLIKELEQDGDKES